MADRRAIATTAAVAAAGAAWVKWFLHVPDQFQDLRGQVAVVTGANSGIGLATATGLAACGMRVIIAGRRPDACEEAAAGIRAQLTGSDVGVARLDLADLEDLPRAVDELHVVTGGRVDVLVNNAGLLTTTRTETAAGYETMFAVNHLGPFALTLRLLPLLRATAAEHGTARIVNVASTAHRQGEIVLDDLMHDRRPFVGLAAYGDSKLANVLFTRELHRRMTGESLWTACCHPGTIASNFGTADTTGAIFSAAYGFATNFMRKPVHGAISPVHLATAPDLPGGGYWVQRSERRPSAAARDDTTARALWAASEELTGVSWPEPAHI